MRTAFIVRNLIQLTQGASCGDLTSLEAMMALLVTRGHIPPAVVCMLWDTFTLKVPGSSMEDSRAAVLILSMAASADQEIVKSNVDILVSRGLGTSGEGAGVCVCACACVHVCACVHACMDPCVYGFLWIQGESACMLLFYQIFFWPS